MVKNVHSRSFPEPPGAIRPHLDLAWSGTPRDVFPLDVIRTWRRNPPGHDPLALVPGVTELGHGPFRFRLERWDGRLWRVTFGSRGLTGWHGFDLEARGAGSVLTHTLEMSLSPAMRLQWALVIEPLHDWAVEALFDRLETALRTGAPPAQTARPMGLYSRTLLGILRRTRRGAHTSGRERTARAA